MIQEPLPLPHDVEIDLRNDKRCTLIHLHGTFIHWGRTRADKDDIVAAIFEKRVNVGRILLTWTGNWKSNVYEIELHDLKRRYRFSPPSTR